jgi:amino acid adenylation domain-containing protein
MSRYNSLGEALLESAEKYCNRPALWCRGRLFSYSEFFNIAKTMAATLISNKLKNPNDRIAVLSDRTVTAYASIVAALFAGSAYVPLNPRFPIDRNRAILELSGAGTLICDERHRPILGMLFNGLPSFPHLVLPESSSPGPVNTPQFVQADLKTTLPATYSPSRAENDLAYILFTSGSTGIPKGVPISNKNVLQYSENSTQLCGATSEDRNIQLADLTFDISVHDMFMTWLNGAALYSVPENGALLATRFIEEHKITGWFSVPSTGSLLKQAGDLIPGSMPSLRATFFCGEPLPGSLAEAWAVAAPNSSIMNLYGPTEATVAFSVFHYRTNSTPPAVVSLGFPLPNQYMGLFSPDGVRCDEGLGEICLSGSQVMSGYWKAPEITASRFFDAEGRRWYRTGDLGRYDPDIGFMYAGRVDRQVKIRGYRVELQEIESVIRSAAGSEMVAVVPWPVTTDGVAMGCVAFVMNSSRNSKSITSKCAQSLPDYMVPNEIISVDVLPTNSNGKIDYLSLQNCLIDRNSTQ